MSQQKKGFFSSFRKSVKQAPDLLTPRGILKSARDSLSSSKRNSRKIEVFGPVTPRKESVDTDSNTDSSRPTRRSGLHLDKVWDQQSEESKSRNRDAYELAKRRKRASLISDPSSISRDGNDTSDSEHYGIRMPSFVREEDDESERSAGPNPFKRVSLMYDHKSGRHTSDDLQAELSFQSGGISLQPRISEEGTDDLMSQSRGQASTARLADFSSAEPPTPLPPVHAPLPSVPESPLGISEDYRNLLKNKAETHPLYDHIIKQKSSNPLDIIKKTSPNPWDITQEESSTTFDSRKISSSSEFEMMKKRSDPFVMPQSSESSSIENGSNNQSSKNNNNHNAAATASLQRKKTRSNTASEASFDIKKGNKAPSETSWDIKRKESNASSIGQTSIGRKDSRVSFDIGTKESDMSFGSPPKKTRSTVSSRKGSNASFDIDTKDSALSFDIMRQRSSVESVTVLFLQNIQNEAPDKDIKFFSDPIEKPEPRSQTRSRFASSEPMTAEDLEMQIYTGGSNSGSVRSHNSNVKNNNNNKKQQPSPPKGWDDDYSSPDSSDGEQHAKIQRRPKKEGSFSSSVATPRAKTRKEVDHSNAGRLRSSGSFPDAAKFQFDAALKDSNDGQRSNGTKHSSDEKKEKVPRSVARERGQISEENHSSGGASEHRVRPVRKTTTTNSNSRSKSTTDSNNSDQAAAAPAAHDTNPKSKSRFASREADKKESQENKTTKKTMGVDNHDNNAPNFSYSNSKLRSNKSGREEDREEQNQEQQTKLKNNSNNNNDNEQLQQVDKYRRAFESLRKEQHKTSEALQEAKMRERERRKQVQSLQQQVETLKSNQSELQQSKSDLAEEKEHMQQQILDLEAQSTARFKQYEDKNHQLQDQLHVTTQTLSDLQVQVDAHSSHRRSSTQDISLLQSQLQELEDGNSDLKQRLEYVEDVTIASLEKTIDGLRQDNKDIAVKRSHEQQTIHALRTELKALKAKSMNYSSDDEHALREQLKKVKNDFSAAMSSLEGQLQESKNMVSSIEDQLKESKRMIEELKAENADHARKRLQDEQTIQALQVEIKTLKANNDAGAEVKVISAEQLRAAESQLADARAKLEDLQNNRNDAKKFEEKIHILNKQLFEAKSDLRESGKAQEKLSHANRQLRELKSKLEKAENKNRGTDEMLRSAHSELRDAKQKMKDGSATGDAKLKDRLHMVETELHATKAALRLAQKESKPTRYDNSSMPLKTQMNLDVLSFSPAGADTFRESLEQWFRQQKDDARAEELFRAFQAGAQVFIDMLPVVARNRVKDFQEIWGIEPDNPTALEDDDTTSHSVLKKYCIFVSEKIEQKLVHGVVKKNDVRPVETLAATTTTHDRLFERVNKPMAAEPRLSEGRISSDSHSGIIEPTKKPIGSVVEARASEMGLELNRSSFPVGKVRKRFVDWPRGPRMTATLTSWGSAWNIGWAQDDRTKTSYLVDWSDCNNAIPRPGDSIEFEALYPEPPQGPRAVRVKVLNNVSNREDQRPQAKTWRSKICSCCGQLGHPAYVCVDC